MTYSIHLQHCVTFIKSTCLYFVSFQPDISKYSADILPLLFEKLVNTSASGQTSASITRTYYALETFCENLGKIMKPESIKYFLYKFYHVEPVCLHCMYYILKK